MGAELISKRIAELADWRGETLARVRRLIREADPEVVEESKWSTPVWSHDGIICTGETYKRAVKLTFAKGASLKDPARRFNASLEGNVRRAIDIHEGEEIDASAFKALIRQAVALSRSSKSKAPKKLMENRRGTSHVNVTSARSNEAAFGSGLPSSPGQDDRGHKGRARSPWPAVEGSEGLG